MSTKIFKITLFVTIFTLILSACAPKGEAPPAPEISYAETYNYVESFPGTEVPVATEAPVSLASNDKQLDMAEADPRNAACQPGFEPYDGTKLEGLTFDGRPARKIAETESIFNYNGDGFTAFDSEGRAFAIEFDYCDGSFMMKLEEIEFFLPATP